VDDQSRLLKIIVFSRFAKVGQHAKALLEERGGLFSSSSLK
jgi:hypothetical protein